MVNHLKHLIEHMRTPTQHSQQVGNPTKASDSLTERVATVGSPLLSFLATLHPIMGMLMKLMLLTTTAGVMSATQDSPWIRRSLLLVALLTTSFTLYRLLSRKHTRWTLLLR